ncbi:MAG TPA: FkbM family methyltransferase [Vicinamibacteria bacterium]|nr:FkbM family methyltransferase [Vicinamibacteria bacterium]
MRAPLSLIPKEAVIPIVQGPLFGRRWIVGSATHGCWLGTYEHTKHRLFAKSILPGSVVFDLGANVGLYTLTAAQRVGPAGRVLAFEPLPRNVQFLRRHLALKYVTNVDVIEAAVSGSSGVASFQEADSPLSGRLGTTGSIHVRTVTIDEMVFDHGLPAPDVVKIDIEGGETAALEGSRRVLALNHPLVFLATHGYEARQQCRDLLTGMGYALEGVDDKAGAGYDEFIARYTSPS